jgi:hypothetical protein
MARCVTKAQEYLGAPQNDRFLYRGLGAIYLAHALLKRVGITIFDLDDLRKEFKDNYEKSLLAIEENSIFTNPMMVLSQTLVDMLPYTLVTKSETQHEATLYHHREPIEIRARHILDTGKVYVSVDAIRKLWQSRQISDKEVLQQAFNTGVLIRPKAGKKPRNYWRKSLTAGVADSTGQTVMAYTFDVKRLEVVLGTPVYENEPAPVIDIATRKEIQPGPSGLQPSQKGN